MEWKVEILPPEGTPEQQEIAWKTAARVMLEILREAEADRNENPPDVTAPSGK